MYRRFVFGFLLVFLASSSYAAENSLTVTLTPDKDAAQRQAQKELKLKHETQAAKTSSTQVYRASVPEKKNANGDSVAIAYVGLISAPKAPIQSRPDGRGRTYYICQQNTPLAILGQNGNYYGVMMADYSTGWVAKAKVKLLDCPVVGTPLQSSGAGYRAVQTAFRFMGIPYRWGGNTLSGLDCSAFVRAVFSNLGISLPRVARDQARVGAEVPLGEIQPGDRLYFACKGSTVDHTGIYIGNGHFIHSSISRGGVAIDKILTPFYLNSLVVVRRS